MKIEMYQCDLCKKRIIGADNMTFIGQDYSYGPNKKKVKIKKQTVSVWVRISLDCGMYGEICDKCAFKIIKKHV